MANEKPKIHNLKAVPKRLVPSIETDPNECPKCFGIGMEVVAGKGARICECRKLKSQHGQLDGVRLPKRYDGFHFHNYKPQTPSQEAAFKFAISLTTEYPAVDRGLLLMGSVGCGTPVQTVALGGRACYFCPVCQPR